MTRRIKILLVLERPMVAAGALGGARCKRETAREECDEQNPIP
jgi:hypothetical protein